MLHPTATCLSCIRKCLGTVGPCCWLYNAVSWAGKSPRTSCYIPDQRQFWGRLVKDVDVTLLGTITIGQLHFRIRAPTNINLPGTFANTVYPLRLVASRALLQHNHKTTLIQLSLMGYSYPIQLGKSYPMSKSYMGS